jgi:hypothetical protein
MRVYLTDGFAGDHVVVSVNGQTVFDGNATTKKLYGLAEQLKPVQVSGSSATMEVRLPEKKLAATFNVDLNQGAHVPVTLEDGKLRHSVQKRIGFM